jgi:hypothetical protein
MGTRHFKLDSHRPFICSAHNHNVCWTILHVGVKIKKRRIIESFLYLHKAWQIGDVARVLNLVLLVIFAAALGVLVVLVVSVMGMLVVLDLAFRPPGPPIIKEVNSVVSVVVVETVVVEIVTVVVVPVTVVVVPVTGVVVPVAGVVPVTVGVVPVTVVVV